MKKAYIVVMVALSILIIFSSCDFDRNNYEEYIKVAFGNQVPFYDYEKNCTEYKIMAKDAYGRELICSMGTTSRRWNTEKQDYDYLYVYLICKPSNTKEEVFLYDIDSYIYSYELLEESNSVIETLKIRNDWDKKIDYEKLISYQVERINQEYEDSLIEKVEEKFEIKENEFYKIDKILINGDPLFFVQKFISYPEKHVELEKSYMFCLDGNEEIINVKELPQDETKWQELIKAETGDVDFASVEPKASYITPVPGGVGPMTISMLLTNTMTSAKNSLKK